MRPRIRLRLLCDHAQPFVDLFANDSSITLVTDGDADLIVTDFPPERFADITGADYSPMICVGQKDDAASAMRALQAGANHYLAQPKREQLLAAFEQALMPSTPHRLDAVAQAAPVMMHLISRNGILLDVNTRCLEELDYQRTDLIGQPLTQLMTSPTAITVTEEYLPRLWQTGSIMDCQNHYQRRTGSVLDVVLNARVLPDDHHAVVTVHNVTGQRKLEAAERDQRLLAEALHSTTTTLTSTLNFDEVLDRILSSVAQVVPFDTANIMLVENDIARMVRNQRATELGREINVPTVTFRINDTPTLHTMFTTGRPLTIPNTDTYARWVHLPQSRWIKSFVGAPIRADDEVIGFLTLNSGSYGAYTQQHAERLLSFANQTSSAIRNARQFETIQRYANELEQRVASRTAELNRERQQLQTILEATGEGIVYIANDHIQYVNQAITNITGYSAAELVGQPLAAFDYKGHFAEKWEAMRSDVEAGDSYRAEIRLRRKDGVKFDAGLTVSLSGIPADGYSQIVVVVRDISQEKGLQNQQSRFIATASHELRTPITNLRTRLYLLNRDPQRIGEHLDVINDVTLRMQKLVEDLLDQSRFERGLIALNLAEVELQQLLSDVVRVQMAEAEAKDIQLRINLTDSPQYIEADAQRLTQVITNLVTNSLHYTPAGGSIDVGLEADDQQAIITVRDNGMGIAPENLSTIFKPFVRGNDRVKGTGLGLSIAQEIVDLHNGRIWVESELDQGSCFFIALPLLNNRN